MLIGLELKPEIYQAMVERGLIYPDQPTNLLEWVDPEYTGDGVRVDFNSPTLTGSLSAYTLSMYFWEDDFTEVFDSEGDNDGECYTLRYE